MIDDATTIEDGAQLTADLCIVGAGAAGISLALQFLHSGVSVLLLAGGPLTPDPQAQALYDGEVADPRLHAPANTYRERRFGGTTTIWGGRCIPFDPIDFESRPYMAHSGWPIGPEALAPFYPRANALCEAGRFAYLAPQAFPHGMRPIVAGFADGDFTTDALERFSCPTDFGQRYQHLLAASGTIRVLLNATCTEIVTTDSGETVQALRIRTLQGRHFDISAKATVLAMGGIEVPRLLLASRRHHMAGLGNAHDLVGRHYMCHIAGTVGTLRVPGPRARVWHGYEISAEGIYCRRRFALSAAAQRRLGVGNFVARLHHPRIPDPSHHTGALSALYLARALIPFEYRTRLTEGWPASLPNTLRHVVNVARDPFGTAGLLGTLLVKRRLAERKFPSIIVRPRSNVFSIDFHAEQQPNPDSRITLLAERDALDVPRVRIDWRYTPGDIRTVTESLDLLAKTLAASGCGTLTFHEPDMEAAIMRDGAYGGHHIGTARMGATARQGVVDAACQVHGVRNLFVASSAVFPTSSQANPTLTIVAITLRLADHLKRLLGAADAAAWPPLPAAEPTPDLMAREVQAAAE